jgi:hypothetical protein
MHIQPANPNSPSVTSETRAHWGRGFAVVTAVMFLISSVFPVAAGLSHDTSAFPQWWGTLDVTIAFLLAILAFGIFGLAHGKENQQVEIAGYRAYRILIHAIIALLAVFFLWGDRIVWSNCLSGFAWRFWLLLYGLPAWLIVFKASRGLGEPSGKPNAA